MTERIYGFLYRPSPGKPFRIGSVWATSAKEANQLAKEALDQAFPGNIKSKLFLASDTKQNRNLLPVRDPDTGEELSPDMARAKEEERRLAVA